MGYNWFKNIIKLNESLAIFMLIKITAWRRAKRLAEKMVEPNGSWNDDSLSSKMKSA